MAGPRRFELHRDTDVHGVSGEGHVADGVLWPDGAATLRWLGEHPCTSSWDAPDGLTHAVAVHGHGGLTRLVWVDQEQGGSVVRLPTASTRSPFRGVTVDDLKRLCAVTGLDWDIVTDLPGPVLHKLLADLEPPETPGP
jgi:hypothetical protein